MKTYKKPEIEVIEVEPQAFLITTSVGDDPIDKEVGGRRNHDLDDWDFEDSDSW